MNIIISIAVIAICAYLWYLGGQGYKWARVLVGGVIGLAKVFLLWNIFALLYWLALYIMTSLFSYGLNAPPHKFWVWVFKKGNDGNYLPVEIATRATCGFFWSLAGIVFAVITGHWIMQIAYTIFLTIAVGFFGVQKKVEISESGTGASVACSIMV